MSFELEPALSIRGSVLNSNGVPVSGALIRVSPIYAAFGTARTPTPRETECRSDDRGDFMCSGLSAGSYECGVWVDGRSASTLLPIIVSDAPMEPIVLRMRPGGTIRASLAHGSEYSDGLTVLAKHGDWAPIEALRRGPEYVFERVDPGAYLVYVGASAEPPSNARLVEVPAEATVNVELVPPPPMEISGILVDGNGSALVDVWVQATPAEFGMGDQADPALTDADGKFTLTGLLPGFYDIEARGGGAKAVLGRVTSGSRNLRLKLPWSGTAESP